MSNSWCSAACSALLAVVLVGAAPAPPGGYYATKYDHIDVDKILNTRRLVNYYAACLTDKGPCTPQGVEFKRILPEALRTNCLRCTEKQRVTTLRAIKRLKKEYPKIWKQLADLWDPTGEYVIKFEESFDITTNTITPTQPDFILNRFGDSSNDNAKTSTTNTPQVTVNNIQKITKPAFSKPVTTTSSTSTSTTTSSTTTTTTTTTTTKPITNKVTYPPPSFATGVAENNNYPEFQTTVSVNGKLGLNGLVRRLGSVGSKVIQAGSRIAGMLISTVHTVVGH